MNINDVTVSWQDISDTERTALLNKPCPPRSKPKALPPRKTPDRITSRVFSICQSAILNNHAIQRPVRLNNLKSHNTLTSSKENVDDAYRTMIEFTETFKRESTNDGNPIEMPIPKRIRSSSPTSINEQCASPTAISRYISHDSYLTFVPAPSSLSSADQCLKNSTMTIPTTTPSHIEADFDDDALWDDWDLPSTMSKRTPGKVRTMSSPAVQSRTKIIPDTTTIVNIPPPLPPPPIIVVEEERKELTPVATATSTNSALVWDDDDDDIEQMMSQFPVDPPISDEININQMSLLQPITTTDESDSTRLDQTRRSSAILNQENQSFVCNTTKIELSSQPNQSTERTSINTLQRSNTGPLSPCVTTTTTTTNSPRTRCDSSSLMKKKTPCTEAEIEQKRLAALALRRQREEEQRRKQGK